MAKRIKILYTIPNFDTAGSGKVVFDLVNHIDKTKFEPHICCSHSRGDFFKQVEELGIPIHIFKVTANYKPFLSLPFRVLKIKKFFRQHNFDVIHSWHWSSDFTEPLAAKWAKIPFVYTKKAMGWGNKSWKWRSQLSSKIVIINTDMASQFFSDMNQKIVPVPIGMHTKDFGILENSQQTSDGISVKQDEFVIVSIANLVEVKGIEFLLDAVIGIENSNIKVFIVGDDTSNYALWLKQKYQSESIVFTGKKQNIKDYLVLADVFVIPTIKKGEGQPIAPIEAMLSGRVVLGSNVSGIKDVLAEFQACLFEPNSVSSLKQKLELVIQMHPDERKQLAKKMYDFAVENYNIETSIKQHENLYLDLVNK